MLTVLCILGMYYLVYEPCSPSLHVLWGPVSDRVVTPCMANRVQRHQIVKLADLQEITFHISTHAVRTGGEKTAGIIETGIVQWGEKLRCHRLVLIIVWSPCRSNQSQKECVWISAGPKSAEHKSTRQVSARLVGGCKALYLGDRLEIRFIFIFYLNRKHCRVFICVSSKE